MTEGPAAECTCPPPFSVAEAEATFGRAGMEKIRKIVDEAPPLSPEQAAVLRSIFADGRQAAAKRDPRLCPTCSKLRPPGHEPD